MFIYSLKAGINDGFLTPFRVKRIATTLDDYVYTPDDTLIEGEIRSRLRENFDVTLPRFDLMAQLDKAPNGMTLGELSQRMMVSNGNVTGLVERLVSLNFVERKPAPNDRRAMIVTLTSEGRRTFRSLARTHEAWVAEIFSDLSQPEMDTMMKLLSKTKTSARKAIDRGNA